MTKRWKQRPPGSTWGDWGEDDELGRINLLTPQKVLEGVREVEHGISFSLSLPLDYPGGSAMNQRRYPPILRPTEDLEHKQDVFYNVVAREQIDPSLIDV
ncbi:cyclase family protein, partial [Streptomyces sp. NPDC057927]